MSDPDITRLHERMDVVIEGQTETKVAIAGLSSTIKERNISTDGRLVKVERAIAGDGEDHPGLVKDVDRLKQWRNGLVLAGTGGAGLGTIGLVIAKAMGYL